MKIQIQQQDLLKIISVVANVVPAKTTLPILTCVLMEAEEDTLTVSATNLDISVVTRTKDLKTVKAGRIAMPAARFNTFIRSLSGGEVVLEEKKGKILINAGKASLEEPSMNPDEFPALPAMAAEKSLQVDGGTIAGMVKSTAYSVSRDETRPALMGILWEIAPDSLGLVATDAHRLARNHRSMEWDVGGDSKIIVDTAGLQHLTRLVDASDDTGLEIFVGENQLSFHIGSTTLHTRLLEGPFPEYDAVIPKNNDKSLIIDREAFSQAIRRVSITADRITSQIRLGIESGKMELTATGTDGSRAEDEIPVSYEGDALEIGFNFNYLQDILKNIETDSVTLSLKDSQSAALIRPHSDDGSGDELLCLLMPLRLTSD